MWCPDFCEDGEIAIDQEWATYEDCECECHEVAWEQAA